MIEIHQHLFITEKESSNLKPFSVQNSTDIKAFSPQMVGILIFPLCVWSFTRLIWYESQTFSIELKTSTMHHSVSEDFLLVTFKNPLDGLPICALLMLFKTKSLQSCSHTPVTLEKKRLEMVDVFAVFQEAPCSPSVDLILPLENHYNRYFSLFLSMTLNQTLSFLITIVHQNSRLEIET